MLKEINLSVQSYIEAHRFILKHRLWKWILIPGILYALLFVAGFYLFWTSSQTATDWMFRQWGVKKWLDLMNSSWLRFLFIIGQIFIHFLLLLFYFSFFKYLFLIIGSPLFSYLSEKTESILLNKDVPFQWQVWVRDVIRGVRISLRNLSWQTVYLVSLLLLSLIPLVGWVAPVVAFFIECYYAGFSMLDYSCERNGMNMSSSIDLIGHHRGLAIGNGMVFYGMHALPLVGWVLAPGYAVIAATLSWHKARHQQVIQL